MRGHEDPIAHRDAVVACVASQLSACVAQAVERRPRPRRRADRADCAQPDDAEAARRRRSRKRPPCRRRRPARSRVAHCRVAGVIGTEIRFSLLMPDDWNHKFLMGGGGGFVGTDPEPGAARR